MKSLSNDSQNCHFFFSFLIDKEKLLTNKRGDTKNSALKVYRKYTKGTKRLKTKGKG